MSFIRRVPVAMSALALALASLGNLLAAYSPAVRLACGAVSAILVLLLVLRLVLDFKGVARDCSSPTGLAVAPAFPMSLMVLATYLKPVASTPALWVWLAALALQLGIVAVFVARHLTSFKLEQVLPSWFLVFVGFAVASLTGPAFAMAAVGTALLYAGIAGYVVVLGVVVYRMVRVGDLPEPALPTLAIFAAPPSLCLAGYLAIAEVKQAVVVYVLLAAAVASLAYVLARLPRILRLTFHPGFAALTFPFVISAIAVKLFAAYGAASESGPAVPQAVTLTFDALAVAMVAYVLVRYVAFLAAPVAD